MYFNMVVVNVPEKFFEFSVVAVWIYFNYPVDCFLWSKIFTLADQSPVCIKEYLPVFMHFFRLIQVIINCCVIGIRIGNLDSWILFQQTCRLFEISEFKIYKDGIWGIFVFVERA